MDIQGIIWTSIVPVPLMWQRTPIHSLMLVVAAVVVGWCLLWCWL